MPDGNRARATIARAATPSVGGMGLAVSSMPIRRLRLAAITVTTILAITSAARSAEPPDHPGRSTYLRYCGACHGPQGKGDGIAGTFMTPKPSDLTQIAKKNDGRFPFSQTMRYIDGTETVRAHGDPDMPVWGEIFRDEATGDSTRRIEVRGKVLIITDYLQSIQAK
jgi:mono/diheme cytochrome c family protein